MVLLTGVSGAQVNKLKIERKINFCIKSNTFSTFKR